VKLYGKVKANMNENLIANEDEKIYQKRTITSLKIRRESEWEIEQERG
jgi:hypothetical protein